MPSPGSIFSGGAGGAMTGFSVGGPTGAVVGGVVGGIAGAFEPSGEDYFQEFLKNLRQRRLERRREVIQGINQQTSAIQANARQAGIDRARAAGRGGLAEAFVAPLEGQAADSGSQAIRTALSSIDQEYDSYENYAGLNRPREAGVSDYLLPIGQSLLDYKMGSDFLENVNPDESPFLQKNNMKISSYNSPTKGGGNAYDFVRRNQSLNRLSSLPR